MEVSKMSTRNIKKQLMNLRLQYLSSANITREMEKEIKEKSNPLIKEMNIRLRKVWEQSGGTAITKYPLRLSFDKYIRHGIVI